MEKKVGKLELSKETLLSLDDQDLANALGGSAPANKAINASVGVLNILACLASVICVTATNVQQ